MKSNYKKIVKPFLKTIKVTNFTLNWLVFGTKLELWELGKVLDTDEKLLYLAPGKYKGTRWLIVVTSRRIILIDRGLLIKHDVKDVYLNKVNGVDQSKGLFFGQIKLESNSGSNDDVITHLWGQDTYRLKKAVEDALEGLEPAFNRNNSMSFDNSHVPDDYKSRAQQIRDFEAADYLTHDEAEHELQKLKEEFTDVKK